MSEVILRATRVIPAKAVADQPAGDTISLTWDERQAVLFDIPNRQFHIFEFTILPQDFWMLSLTLLFFAILLATIFSPLIDYIVVERNIMVDAVDTGPDFMFFSGEFN